MKQRRQRRTIQIATKKAPEDKRTFDGSKQTIWIAFGLIALPALVDGIGVHPLPAAAIVTVAAALLSYLLHKRYSFGFIAARDATRIRATTVPRATRDDDS